MDAYEYKQSLLRAAACYAREKMRGPTYQVAKADKEFNKLCFENRLAGLTNAAEKLEALLKYADDLGEALKHCCDEMHGEIVLINPFRDHPHDLQKECLCNVVLAKTIEQVNDALNGQL